MGPEAIIGGYAALDAPSSDIKYSTFAASCFSVVLSSISDNALSKALQVISAAFLIESLSLKGFVLNNARVSEKHSLVLENKSDKSEDILDLASHIQASVLENYNINLELEPQIF